MIVITLLDMIVITPYYVRLVLDSFVLFGSFELMCRWALTHPLTISEYENLKKLLKPDFEDMVPWYSGYVIGLYINSYYPLDVVKVV
jgi:hypothetical protein